MKKTLTYALTVLLGIAGIGSVALAPKPTKVNAVTDEHGHVHYLSYNYVADSYTETAVGNNNFDISITYQINDIDFNYLALFEKLYISLPTWSVHSYSGYYNDYYATFFLYGGRDLYNNASTPTRYYLSRDMVSAIGTQHVGYSVFRKYHIDGFNLFDSSNFYDQETTYLFMQLHMTVDGEYIERPNTWVQSINFYNYLLPVVGAYQDGYDLGYDEGWEHGLDLGKNVGYNSGYQDGMQTASDFDAGYNSGYQDGYNTGYSLNDNHFYLNLHTWIVPAIISVLFIGGGLVLWKSRNKSGD